MSFNMILQILIKKKVIPINFEIITILFLFTRLKYTNNN